MADQAKGVAGSNPLSPPCRTWSPPA